MKGIIKIYKDSFNGLSKDVWIFALMMLINRLGTLILPFLTLYTTKVLGWTKIDAGKATMCFGIGSLSGALIGGYLTDRIGYYKTMMISLFSAAVFFFILQYFSDFYLFCGFILISSALADLLRPAVMTGITFFTNKETQTRAVSLIRIAFNVGFTVGPAIAGLLVEKHGYSLIFIFESVTCFLAGIFLILYVKDKDKSKDDKIHKEKTKANSPYRDKIYLLFLFFNFCMLLSFFQILFTVPLYMYEELHWTEKHFGYYLGVNGLIIFLLEMPLIHYLEQRYSKFRLMIFGAWLTGFSFLVYLLPFHPLMIISFSLLLVSFGELINFPFIASSSMDRSNKDNIGQYMSANTVLFSIALIIAPLLGTFIVETWGYNILFIILFLLCLVSIVGLTLIKEEFYKNIENTQT